MSLWLMPLEPIEERYTGQWYEWFPEVLGLEGIEYEMIDGEAVESELEGEFFLDPIATNIWKSTQLRNLLGRIDNGEVTDGDTIFFFDLWYPGIESLAYIRDLTGIEFEIAGVLHAGTYDPHDLTAQAGMDSWGQDLENSWFSFIDTAFVATMYHKNLLMKQRKTWEMDLQVTGLPVDIKRLVKMRSEGERNDRVVFTGRQSDEKGWPFIRELRQKGYNVFSTLSYDFDKDEYYEFLADSKAVIAPSKQETFGYGVVEGMALGCEPIVPDALAFQQTVPDGSRYEYRESAERRVRELTVEGKTRWEIVPRRLMRYQYQNVIKQMLQVLEG